MALGLLLIVIGAVVHLVGTRWLDLILPPVVTGAIVALIGFNLAPAAKNNFEKGPFVGIVTLVLLVVALAFFRGIIGRLAIFLAVVLGYLLALALGDVDTSSIGAAPWIGLPEFQAPTFTWSVLPLFLPAVIALIAENIGHVKSVGQMTGTDTDPLLGRALAADGVATTLAGLGGGTATTTYAENIGVMAATRVYSTAAYWIAAAVAIGLSLCPKVGATISAIPPGVLGGATIVLYGLVGVLGVRIWLTNHVDFSQPINQMTAAIALIIGIADFTWQAGSLTFTGIALGAIAALLVYHGMGLLGWRTRTVAAEPAEPVSGAAVKDSAPVEAGRVLLGGGCRSCRRRVADGCGPSAMRPTTLLQSASRLRHASCARRCRLRHW